jgi:hypothetical protein
LAYKSKLFIANILRVKKAIINFTLKRKEIRIMADAE